MFHVRDCEALNVQALNTQHALQRPSQSFLFQDYAPTNLEPISLSVPSGVPPVAARSPGSRGLRPQPTDSPISSSAKWEEAKGAAEGWKDRGRVVLHWGTAASLSLCDSGTAMVWGYDTAQIVRYRSGETNEEPECVERRGAIQKRPNKKYISRRFDSIRQKKILDTGGKKVVTRW